MSSELTFGDNPVVLSIFLDLDDRDVAAYLFQSHPDVFLLMNNEITSGARHANLAVSVALRRSHSSQ